MVSLLLFSRWRAWAWSCGLAGAFALSSGSVAQAQFLPGGIRPGIYAYSPATGRAAGLSFNYGYRLNFVGRNPVTGQVTGVTLAQSYAGPLPINSYRNAAYLGYLQNVNRANTPYFGGAVAGSGTLDPAFNPIVQEQMRVLRAAGAQQDVNEIQARKMLAEQLAQEQQARAAANPNIDPELLRITEEKVASGEIFAPLTQAILKLEASVGVGNSPLLPPELMAKLHYSPSVAADLLELFRAGPSAMPEFMNERDWIVIRLDLQKVLTPIFDAISAGKSVSAVDLSRLSRQLKITRNEVVPLSRSLDFDQATRLNHYLNQLERLGKLAEQPKLQSVYRPNWTITGATVSELVHHHAEHQLQLDAAAEGDHDAYMALYRAMLEYHEQLAAKKLKK